MAERKHNAIHAPLEQSSCLVTSFISSFQRDLLVMLCFSASPKHQESYSVGQTTSTSNMRSLWPSLKCFLILTTRLLRFFSVSTRRKVYIVTCTSSLGTCHVVCKEQCFGIMRTKVCSFTSSTEGESLCRGSFECTNPDLLCNLQMETLLTLMNLEAEGKTLALSNDLTNTAVPNQEHISGFLPLIWDIYL